MNILIIEDEQKIARYLAKGLTESGYRTWLAHDGREGLMLFEQHAIDLVILDVMLPELDGWQVIQTLRQFSEVPVLFLTARDSVLDRVKGLELGADDYLVKPFSYIELLARVKTLLRRSSTKVVEQLQVENLKIDLLEHKVYRDRDLIELTNKEYALPYVVWAINLIQTHEYIPAFACSSAELIIYRYCLCSVFSDRSTGLQWYGSGIKAPAG